VVWEGKGEKTTKEGIPKKAYPKGGGET